MEESLIEYIEHDAVVSAVDPRKGTVTVSVTDSAECGECPAARLCAKVGKDTNRLTIAVRDPQRFRTGDTVVIRGSERLHRKAIMLATVIPSLALVAVMIIVYIITGNQLGACLAGLGAMIFFFAALWFARERLAHEFSFDIEKTDAHPTHPAN